LIPIEKHYSKINNKAVESINNLVYSIFGVDEQKMTKTKVPRKSNVGHKLKAETVVKSEEKGKTLVAKEEEKVVVPSKVGEVENETKAVRRSPGKRRKEVIDNEKETQEVVASSSRQQFTSDLLDTENNSSSVLSSSGHINEEISEMTPKRKRKLSLGQHNFATSTSSNETSPVSPGADLSVSPRRGPKRIRSQSTSSIGETRPEESPANILLEFLNALNPNPPKLSRKELLRAGTWLFDELLTRSFSRPFVNPVPEDAIVYRREIKRLMDLTTAERKLWAGKYKDLNDLYADVVQILSNAITFHQEGQIYEEAKEMCEYFTKVLYPHISRVMFGGDLRKSINEMMPLLHEEYFGIKTFSPELIREKRQQTIANKKSVPSTVLDRLDHFNRGLTDYFTDGIQPAKTPNLEESSLTRDFIRVYLTKGLSTLN
ncbi:18397_t:CDS:2, partial [Acaulospora morrowiae]